MKAWNAIVIAAVIVVTAINLIATARRLPPPSRVAPEAPRDVVLRQEARLASVRGALERAGARGAIGYVADSPPDELAVDARGMQEYFLSQFVLVPRVLDARLGDGRWAIVNLRRTSLAERMPAGFHVVEDCGGGVWLIEKNAP